MARNNNDFLNITVSSLVNQVRRTADPTKICEAGALAKGKDGRVRTKKESFSRLGRIIIAARGKIDKIKNLEYPQVDAAVPVLAEYLKRDIDDQMFMQDVARGVAQQGQQTKAEIVRLNQNSLDYVALQGIFLDKWIDDTATLIAEICQANYDIDRLFKMVSDGVKAGMKVDQMVLDVRFDVNIEPGSTLPFDELKKQNEYMIAYKLLENPIPNPLLADMLRILNISKRKEILEKHQGVQLFRQFMMMGSIFMQADPKELQGIVAAAPELQRPIQLLLQAGQLAPQIQGAI